MTSFLIFLGLIAAIVFWAIGIYNRLVNERNRVRNAFAQIDVQLTRRHDLIPNLVEAVKGYMKHERETLEAEEVIALMEGRQLPPPESPDSPRPRKKSRATGQDEADWKPGALELPPAPSPA